MSTWCEAARGHDGPHLWGEANSADPAAPYMCRAIPSDTEAIRDSATRLEGALVVESITVREDLGGPYPRFKRVTLDLMPDGSVRWRDIEYP